jgi:hypothetical protein
MLLHMLLLLLSPQILDFFDGLDELELELELELEQVVGGGDT